jgi:hypothetical protein
MTAKKKKQSQSKSDTIPFDEYVEMTRGEAISRGMKNKSKRERK